MNDAFILLDIEKLQSLKKSYQQKAPSAVQAVQALVQQADAALSHPFYTVTAKQKTAPGGDPHDYSSLATYWWPNPETKDGLPYIRKDGYVNPQGRDDTLFDRNKLDCFAKDLSLFSTAYFYTDDQRYFDRASALMDTWFFNPDTYMRPHLQYAQCIPGVCDGRDIGIIDTYYFTELIDSAILLGYEKLDDLRQWMETYLNWLLTSENGKGEERQKNNHGLWYDAQVISLASFCGKTEIIRQRFERTCQRLDKQIEKDGSLPEELARTRSLSYTFFALFAMVACAQVYDKYGLDLWNYTNEKGTGIKTCFDFLMPYMTKQRQWQWQQIDPLDKKAPCICFACFSRQHPDRSYDQCAAAFAAQDELCKLRYPIGS